MSTGVRNVYRGGCLTGCRCTWYEGTPLRRRWKPTVQVEDQAPLISDFQLSKVGPRAVVRSYHVLCSAVGACGLWSVVCGLWPSVDFSRLVHATRPFGPIRLPCFACFPMFIVRSVFLVNSSAMLVQSSPIQSNPIDPSIHLRLCVCTRLVSNCLLGLSAGSIDCCSSSSRIPNIPVLTTHINLAARSTTRNHPSGCCYSLILISLHQFFFLALESSVMVICDLPALRR